MAPKPPNCAREPATSPATIERRKRSVSRLGLRQAAGPVSFVAPFQFRKLSRGPNLEGPTELYVTSVLGRRYKGALGSWKQIGRFSTVAQQLSDSFQRGVGIHGAEDVCFLRAVVLLSPRARSELAREFNIFRILRADKPLVDRRRLQR